ncbi:hypothetical protein LCGC14_0551960 [marine sediment metagenome]|uniref:Uncharacterized protein n=1 Tax=marine sediment metagenome TaxID=412755 RepID=A0A0F9RUN8_9ZZZZ
MVGLTRREVVQSLDRSSRTVTETAAFTFDPRVHGGRITLLSLLAGYTATLPAAIGSGVIYRIHVGIVRTSNSYIIQVINSSDNMEGSVTIVDSDTNDNCEGFVTTSNTSDTITMNATTTGGLTIGDWIELVDIAANVWHVRGQLSGSGDLATPFSAAV